MGMLFKLGVAWLFLSYYFIYLQTNVYGYLVVSIGAALNLCAYLFLDHPVLARVVSISGTGLFWIGIGVLATFGMRLERERLHLSTWSEILRGLVPESIRTTRLTKQQQVAHGLIFSVLFAIIFFVVGDTVTAFSFVLLSVVFLLYHFSRYDRPQ